MYEKLSKELIERIAEDRKSGSINPYAFKDENAVRRKRNPHDAGDVLRSNFMRDADKITNCPFFSRYEDKTQVFSLYKNDDITHRSLHVQFVSRIARTIGKALSLNVELIEAIALGHDLGHTPFGHSGEYVLDEIYREKTGRRFLHNLQSVRVVDKIFPLNVTMETLDGILSHNGEIELNKYVPKTISGFDEFDEKVENCYIVSGYAGNIMPSTLEGCVVRIADIIAYIGKDRNDALIAGLKSDFTDGKIGVFNAEMVNNLTIDIIENSYNKPYIKLGDDYFDALKKAKKENYDRIYLNPKVKGETENALRPMMITLYEKLLDDLVKGDDDSPIFKHHINYLNKPYYKRAEPYENTEKNQIVVDFIASMTDDYFIDIYNELFPDGKNKLNYVGYFK